MSDAKGEAELGEGVDALIVTAIKLEYDEVLKVDAGAWSGSKWEVRKGPLGLDVAFRLFMAADGQPLQVAVTWATDMGGVATASAAERLIAVYSPRCIAMCGVCAGRRGDVNVGDVIIADRMWMYDAGKLKAEIGDDGRRIERVQGDMLTYLLRADWKQRAEAFVVLPETNAWLAERPPACEAQADWILEPKTPAPSSSSGGPSFKHTLAADPWTQASQPAAPPLSSPYTLASHQRASVDSSRQARMRSASSSLSAMPSASTPSQRSSATEPALAEPERTDVGDSRDKRLCFSNCGLLALHAGQARPSSPHGEPGEWRAKRR